MFDAILSKLIETSFSFMNEVDDETKSIPEPKTSRWVILDVGSR